MLSEGPEMDGEERLRATLRKYAERAATGRDLWPPIARAVQMELPPVQPRRLRAGVLALVPVLLIGLVLWVGFGGLRGVTPGNPSATPRPPAQLTTNRPDALIQAHNGYT